MLLFCTKQLTANWMLCSINKCFIAIMILMNKVKYEYVFAFTLIFSKAHRNGVILKVVQSYLTLKVWVHNEIIWKKFSFMQCKYPQERLFRYEDRREIGETSVKHLVTHKLILWEFNLTMYKSQYVNMVYCASHLKHLFHSLHMRHEFSSCLRLWNWHTKTK